MVWVGVLMKMAVILRLFVALPSSTITLSFFFDTKSMPLKEFAEAALSICIEHMNRRSMEGQNVIHL